MLAMNGCAVMSNRQLQENNVRYKTMGYVECQMDLLKLIEGQKKDYDGLY